MNQGTLSILVSLAVAAAGGVLLALGQALAGSALLYVGGSAAIGAVTNRIAIAAIFSPWPSRRLALPGTGLVERNREKIIEAIARSVAEDLVTPQTLSTWLREADFFDKLRHYAAGHVRELSRDPQRRRRWSEKLRGAFRRRADEVLESSRLFRAVRDFFARRAGLVGKIGNATGLADYDHVAYRIVDGIKERFASWTDEGSDWFDEQFAAALEEAADDLEHWDMRNSEKVAATIEYVAEEVDVDQIVRGSLERFTAEEVKQLVYGLSRDHLSLLELWGAVLGAVAGGSLWAISRLLGLL